MDIHLINEFSYVHTFLRKSRKSRKEQLEIHLIYLFSQYRFSYVHSF